MPRHADWRTIGPCEIRRPDGSARSHASLTGAVRALGSGMIRRMEACEDGNRSADRYWHLSGHVRDYPGFTLPVVLDEMGLVVPMWRITMEADAIGLHRRPWRPGRYHSRFGLIHYPPYEFRSGPVSGVRKGRGGWHRERSPATSQERAMAHLHSIDEEVAPYVTVRGRRRGRNLPSYLEDCHRGPSQRTWKKHRRTRWRDDVPVDA